MPQTFHHRVAALYGLLAALNLGAWLWALLLFRDHPLLLGTALIAYGFGLRHGVDADHIAAIDNATRKLMHRGQRPIATGFWFALGHSSVVLLAAAGVALTTSALSSRFDVLTTYGALIGTSVSALFLFLIAVMNLAILLPIWRAWRHVRAGGAYIEADLDPLLNNRGLLARLFRPLFRLVTRSWHLYPVGFLFGLGFDTATEIALLGISATQAGAGLAIWSIMVFPLLFAAGMTLVDTTDGLLMLGAYRWAFVNPSRKLAYNLSITAISVVTALVIGGAEALALIADQARFHGLFWDAVAGLNGNLNLAGMVIVALCALVWLLSAAVWRMRRPTIEADR